MKKTALLFAIAVTSLCLSLLLAEFIVRHFKLAPETAWIKKGRYALVDNPKLGYIPLPDPPSDPNELAGYDYVDAESNSGGFRDRDHKIKKDPSTFRIVLLGDSISVGLWIDSINKIYPYLLEKILIKSKINAEVINLSVVGYNTRQEVEILKREGLAYKPDLVVLQYCHNDTTRNDGNLLADLLRSESDNKKVSVTRISSLARYSHLFRMVWFRYIAKKKLEYKDDVESNLNLLSKDTTEEAFKELSLLSKKHGFKVLAVVFPDFTDLEDYHFKEKHEELRTMSKNLGLKYLDLLDSFRSCRKETNMPMAFDLYHPTADGHACAAKAIADKIKELFFN